MKVDVDGKQLLARIQERFDPENKLGLEWPLEKPLYVFYNDQTGCFYVNVETSTTEIDVKDNPNVKWAKDVRGENLISVSHAELCAIVGGIIGMKVNSLINGRPRVWSDGTCRMEFNYPDNRSEN